MSCDYIGPPKIIIMSEIKDKEEIVKLPMEGIKVKEEKNNTSRESPYKQDSQQVLNLQNCGFRHSLFESIFIKDETMPMEDYGEAKEGCNDVLAVAAIKAEPDFECYQDTFETNETDVDSISSSHTDRLRRK